jgi:hypothetical protein
MSFLNPLFLIGVLAVAGPILVHLFRRQDARKLPFSSLIFIRHSPNRSWRRLRLRHLLLFALRSAAIILLVLSFARPYLARDSQVSSAAAGRKSVVVLVDTSFSMRSGDRMERARGEASRVFGQMAEKDAAFLVGFSDVSQLTGEPRSRPELLSAMVADLEPSYRRTDYSQAMKLASQLLSSAPNDIQEIHLISDFQLSGWDEANGSLELADNVNLVLHDVGDAEEFNVFLASVEISETGDANHAQAKVAARITSTGDFSGPVHLEINGKKIQEKQVTVEKGRTATVEFDPFALGGSLSRGSIRVIADDSLSEDNASFFVLNPQNRQRVLLLTSTENSRDRTGGEDLFVRQALTASPRTPFQVRVEKLGSAGSIDLAPYSGVLLYDPGRISPGVANNLRDFVSKGGGLVIVVGDRTEGSELNDKFAETLPARLGAKRSDAKGVSLIANLQKRHPVFQVFEPVHQSYFLTTPFRRYLDAVPAEGSSSLMELEGNRPLLIEKASGKGRVLLFASAFNTDWNDLPLKSVFLPFCQEMVKYAMSFEGTSRSFAVGESVPVGRLNANLEKAVTELSTSAFKQGWKVHGPSGRIIDLTEEELLASPFLVLEEPGYYETEVRNVKDSVAVNVVSAESDLRKLDTEQFLASILRTPARDPVGWAGGHLSPEKRFSWETKQSIWWYLVLVALALLLLEGYLAARYGRIETQ